MPGWAAVLSSYSRKYPLSQWCSHQHTRETRVIERIDHIIDTFGEVSPSVDVSGNDHLGAEHFSRRYRPRARQRQRAAALPTGDASATNEQHCDIDRADPLGDLADHSERRIVAADVDRRNPSPLTTKPLTSHVTLPVPSRVPSAGPCTAGTA